MKNKNTSWENVAGWYDEYLENGKDTYQSKVILPNLIRLMDIKKGQKILDIACGTGFFSRQFHKIGAVVAGVDASENLIKIAREKSPKDITYFTALSSRMTGIRADTHKRFCPPSQKYQKAHGGP